MDKIVLAIYIHYKNNFELHRMQGSSSISLRNTPYFFRFDPDTLQYSLRSINDIVTDRHIKSGKQIIKLIRLLGVPK